MLKHFRFFAVTLLGLLWCRPAPVQACSAFQILTADGWVVAKSYDWFAFHGHGAVYMNPRGMQRTGLGPAASQQPASWVARYGSLTFTQFGQGLPVGGVNENGLVVEMLQLDPTRYNSQESDLPFVNESQWTQFQLDNYRSVAEVEANLDRLRVDPLFIGIHYFISDASGDTAVVEFLGGKPVMYRGATLPIRALTNDPYLVLMKYLIEHQSRPVRTGFGKTSEERFRILAHAIAPSEVASLADATKILDAVRLDGLHRDALLLPSQWNLQYAMGNETVSFRTRKHRQFKTIRWGAIDWEHLRQVKVLDMNSDQAGDVSSRFEPVTESFNRHLTAKSRLLLLSRPGLRNRALAMARAEGTCSSTLAHEGD